MLKPGYDSLGKTALLVRSLADFSLGDTRPGQARVKGDETPVPTEKGRNTWKAVKRPGGSGRGNRRGGYASNGLFSQSTCSQRRGIRWQRSRNCRKLSEARLYLPRLGSDDTPSRKFPQPVWISLKGASILLALSPT